ncbi:hypothetical protein, partial [Polaromonas sp.]|uniref:hypothetical protein n=1 Tax=Polaromonas sp. TaxID=1869339 RepID=UPI0025EC70AA
MVTLSPPPAFVNMNKLDSVRLTVVQCGAAFIPAFARVSPDISLAGVGSPVPKRVVIGVRCQLQPGTANAKVYARTD